jgi:integrase/recombinase XerD
VLERLNYVRQFAEHVAWFDPATEVPALDGRPYGSHRPRPHIYTREQIGLLLAAAGRLTPQVRAATWQTLLGLLTVTGLRISEARNLDDDDITPDESGGGWVRITDTKFGKSRLVPLHASTLTAIRRYQRLRDATFPAPSTTAVFVARRGTRIARSTAGNTFRELRILAGMAGGETEPAARLHDFRHSFATNTLIGHIRSGGDVEEMMPVLSAWLGHVSPDSTYWYLSSTPELAAALAARLPVNGADDE